MKSLACTDKTQLNLPDRSFNLDLFREIVFCIKEADKTAKIETVKKLFELNGLISHYTDKITKRVILANCVQFEYPHELHTSQKLTGADYDVIFVPKGYFKRSEKKFDVFLSRGHIFLESDLKCISSTNPDTIGNRIKEGSEQSVRVVGYNLTYSKKEVDRRFKDRVRKKKYVEGDLAFL